MGTTRKFLVAGQLTLVLGILCSMLNTCLFDHNSILDFLCGAFMGMSMVMNLTFLLKYRQSNKRDY